MLKDSRGKNIRNTARPLVTGQKWTPSDAVQEAISTLRPKDIVEQVHRGRGGFGLMLGEPTWWKATKLEGRALVGEEVRREREVSRNAKSVSLGKQG